MATTVKTPIILEASKDWIRWYEAVRRSADAKEVLDFVDIDADTQPVQPQRPVEPEYTDVKPGAAAWIALSADEKEQYRFLTQKYRMKLDLYKEQKKALNELQDFIHNTVAAHLAPLMDGLSTVYDILQALKKRLALTDRTRRLQLAQEYNALKTAPSKAQSTERWLQQWEITYAEADKHNLAEIQDHRAVYDFIQAIKAIDPAYASAY
jgi:hypothetical protein